MVALCLLPLIALGGLMLDVRKATNHKAYVQSALDASALAGAKSFIENFKMELPERKQLAIDSANALFNEEMRLAGNSFTADSLQISITDDYELSVSTAVHTPTTFASLAGINEMSSSMSATAVAGDVRGYEIVLVLDNTTSMFSANRMNNMRDAAKTFTEIVFAGSPEPELTKIGVIPYGATLNINVEQPAIWDDSVDDPVAKTASVAPAGSRIVPAAAFNDRRQYLSSFEDGSNLSATELAWYGDPVEWRGCIRGAPGERRVTGGGSVPQPLTDDAVPGMRWPLGIIESERGAYFVHASSATHAPPPDDDDDDDDDDSGPPPDPDPDPEEVQGSLNDLLRRYDVHNVRPLIEQAGTSSYGGHGTWTLMCTPPTSQITPGGIEIEGARNQFLRVDEACTTGTDIAPNGMLDSCVSDPNEFEYFANGGNACPWQPSSDIFPWDAPKGISGPNINCPTAMLGMSSSPTQIFSKLDEMYPVPGGTQMDVGLMWGLRAMSDRNEWTNFFGYQSGEEPTPFAVQTTRKVMILLTDGENKAPFHFEGYYGCKEGNTRGGNAKACWKHDDIAKLDQASLDALTLDACTEIRDTYNIELYTIAVGVTDPATIASLEACAGTAANAFNVQSGQLGEVFEGLAKRTLRLKE